MSRTIACAVLATLLLQGALASRASWSLFENELAPTIAPTPAPAPAPEAAPSFEIAEDQFWVNGEPTQIISGSIHYFRIHPELWEDRLLRVKALGVNAIQTYVPWNLHEPLPGQFNFSGFADVESFLELANSLDLMVLLRVGPYVCAEWDLGGLPSWLLTLDPEVDLRSSDPFFLAQVDAWWDVLLPKIKPFMWAEGGPVVMVQVENEFGFLGVNDTVYLTHLVNKTRTALGNDTVIYTTDPATPATLGNGTLVGEQVYTAVDAPITADMDAVFALQKLYNAPGKSPPMITEFYLGWLTHWGEAMPVNNATLASAQLAHILALNASVNFYMAHGGTSFGFNSGANTLADKNQYLPDITSYDYTAPIGEGGDTDSPFYAAVRAVIKNHTASALPKTPKLLPRKALPLLNFTEAVSLFDALPFLSSTPDGIPAVWPKKMEYFNQTSGFILYTAALPFFKATDELTIFGVKDRAHVFITTPAVPASPIDPAGAPAKGPVRRLLGMMERWVPKLKLPLAPAAPKPTDQVQILVENMGRVNFGPDMLDETKGVGAVMLGFIPIFHWNVHPLPLSDVSAVPFKPIADLAPGPFEPTFFLTTFNLSSPVDTFLSLKGWSKGVAFVNGFNLGRYWPVIGPQCHLYIPAPLLHKGTNELILFEVDAAPAVPSVSFTNTTDFTCGPVPLIPIVPAGVIQSASSTAAVAM